MFKFLGVLGELFDRVLKWWDEQQAIAKGRDIERAQEAQQVQEKADVAEEVRQDVRDAVAADPDSLRDDDGFRRPD